MTYSIDYFYFCLPIKYLNGAYQWSKTPFLRKQDKRKTKTLCFDRCESIFSYLGLFGVMELLPVMPSTINGCRLVKTVSRAQETICATWTEAKQLPEVLIMDNNIKRLRVRFLPRHATAVSLGRLRWNETQRVINILCLPETEGLLPGYAEIQFPRRSPLQEASCFIPTV